MIESRTFSAWTIRQFLICAALLMVAGCATKSPVGKQGAPSAKVVGLKGAARYKTGSDGWQMLRTGDVVKPGTIVETAGKSRLDLVLDVERPGGHFHAEQDLVRVWENSRLSLDKLTVRETGADLVQDIQLDLQAGHIFGKVGKMSPASRYEVRIPNAVASIRGTVYDITAEGEVKAPAGSLLLTYTDSNGEQHNQVILGSQVFDPRTGATASASDPWRGSPVRRRF
jgi:hypothetical protein